MVGRVTKIVRAMRDFSDTDVEKHGGTISFEIDRGKGTTFVIRLPLLPDTAPEDDPRPEVSEEEMSHA